MAKSKRKPAVIEARAKLWLEANGAYAFGLGISSILKAVDQAGSMKEAAALVGKSYRHVWSRIKEAEDALGICLVETQVGGSDPRRSRLTAEAQTLVREFDRLRDRVFALVDREFADALRSLSQKARHSASQ